MVFGVPYSKIINASFAYTGQGGRFHAANSVRGAWYCALEVATAIAEVTFHRLRMLAEVGRDAEADIPERQFVADVHGAGFRLARRPVEAHTRMLGSGLLRRRTATRPVA